MARVGGRINIDSTTRFRGGNFRGENNRGDVKKFVRIKVPLTRNVDNGFVFSQIQRGTRFETFFGYGRREN